MSFDDVEYMAFASKVSGSPTKSRVHRVELSMPQTWAPHVRISRVPFNRTMASGLTSQILLVSWWDHSRDLLHLINVFSDQMPRPIVGLGHSLGGTQM